MKLNDAYQIAIEIVGNLESHFLEWKICGSIRRKMEEVKDIDIVAVEKTNYEFGEKTLAARIESIDPTGAAEAKEMGRHGVSRFLNGPSIKRFKYKGIMIDLYLATPDTYSCLVLIKTGSAAHNVRLTTLAMGKGWKLFASGKGLCEVDPNDREKIIRVIATQEEDILERLLGRVPEPEKRN